MPTPKYNLFRPEKFSSRDGNFEKAYGFPALLEALHADGTWSYFWTIDAAGKKRTQWFRAGEAIPAIPADAKAVYFGVHPASTDRADLKREAIYQRSTLATVEAINALFAEFDAKDGWADLVAVQAHLTAIGAPLPSAIVESGGGWHFYWLLRERWTILNDGERKWFAALQARWVAFVGSDPGAKDLARVLRVPGSLNCKYDPPRPVQLLAFDPGRHYMLAELEALLPALKPEPIPAPEPAQDAPKQRRSNSEQVPELRAAGIMHKCKARMVEGNRNSVTFWFACRCNDLSVPAADAERLALDLARPAGLAEHEVLATVRSAYRQMPDPTRAAPPMPGRNADRQAAPLEEPAEPDGFPDLDTSDPDLAQEDLVGDFDQVVLTPEPEAPPEWGNLDIEPELDAIAQKRIHDAMGGVKPRECGLWVIRPRISGGKAIKFQVHCGHCDTCIRRRADRYQKLVLEKILSGLPLMLAKSLQDLKTVSGKRSRQCETFELLQGVGQEYYTCWPLGPETSALLVVETEILPDARNLAKPLGIVEFNALPFDFWLGMAKGESKRRVSGRLLTDANDEPPDETETPAGEVFQVCAFSGAREGDIVKATSAVREKLAVTAQDHEAFQGYLDTLGTRMLVWLQTHGTPRARMWKLRARIDREAVATNHIGIDFNTRLIARICDENGLEPWPECEIPIDPK